MPDKTILAEDEVLITPKYLLSVGFIPHDQSEYIWDFDYPFHPEYNDLLFIEKELDRKMFAVILNPDIYEGESNHDGIHYSFDILIRNDVGCGFTAIPNQFCYMPIKYFEMLYESIRRESLKLKRFAK